MRVQCIETPRYGDSRGWFSEIWSEARFASLGIAARFVQDNQSYSAAAGTVRGIHFQVPPRAQAKLVRCVRGALCDIAVDLRRGSPTYGRYVSTLLSAENGRQLYIPEGFGHGFVTLEPDTEVAYKVSDIYAPDHERGVLWNDPDMGVVWPLPPSGPVLSDKDRHLPPLCAFDSPFAYHGDPLEALDAG